MIFGACVSITSSLNVVFQMPKGGLLHAHLDATVNMEFVLKIALEQPALHVRSPQPLSNANISKTLPEFRALTQEMFTESNIALTDPSYPPNTWVSLKKARDTFDPALGGPEGFDNWVVGSMTINPSEGKSSV
jgi:adenosine deaminase CECR1